MSGRAREKSNRQEKAFERRDRMLDNRRTEDRATVEEVFDQSTRMVLFKFLNNGVLNEVSGVISAGKEARVYWGKTKEGEERAVKIYLTSSAEFKRGSSSLNVPVFKYVPSATARGISMIPAATPPDTIR